jgi:hypothetical protein
MPLTPAEEFKAKLDVVNAFGETAKSYIQISSLALALPLVFIQAILGKDAADKGLRSVGVPCTLYAGWSCFLLAIGFGLIYQWSSIRRVWDELHAGQLTTQNATAPGFRKTWWVVQLNKLNLSTFYGSMMLFFFAGLFFFVVFAASLLRG